MRRAVLVASSLKACRYFARDRMGVDRRTVDNPVVEREGHGAGQRGPAHGGAVGACGAHRETQTDALYRPVASEDFAPPNGAGYGSSLRKRPGAPRRPAACSWPPRPAGRAAGYGSRPAGGSHRPGARVESVAWRRGVSLASSSRKVGAARTPPGAPCVLQRTGKRALPRRNSGVRCGIRQLRITALLPKGFHEHPRVPMTNSVCNSGRDSTRPPGPATDRHRVPHT